MTAWTLKRSCIQTQLKILGLRDCSKLLFPRCSFFRLSVSHVTPPPAPRVLTIANYETRKMRASPEEQKHPRNPIPACSRRGTRAPSELMATTADVRWTRDQVVNVEELPSPGARSTISVERVVFSEYSSLLFKQVFALFARV